MKTGFHSRYRHRGVRRRKQVFFKISAQGIAHGVASAQGILSGGMAFCADKGFQTSYEIVVGSFKSAAAIEEKIKIFKNFKRSIKYFGVSPI